MNFDEWGKAGVRNAFQGRGRGGVDQNSFKALAHPNGTLELQRSAGTSCANSAHAAVVQHTSAGGCLAWGGRGLGRGGSQREKWREREGSRGNSSLGRFFLLPRL